MSFNPTKCTAIRVTSGKRKKTYKSNYILLSLEEEVEVSKDAKIRNRYNQVPHLTQDTNGKVTNSQLDTTNESQEVSR